MTADAARLKAAAFDAAGAALEILGPDGAPLLRNAAAGAGNGPPGAGRARLVEAVPFAFEGADYQIVASLDNDAQRRLQDELFSRAYFDASTGLPNRALLERAIADLIAGRPERTPFAAIVIEIDRFHEIVAFHGPEASEALAARIGERLQREAGPADLVTRTNPDEFCILAGAPSPDLARVAAHWARRAGEPYLVDGVEIFVSACAGACLWPQGDASPQGLRRKARAAAREARRQGEAARLFETAMEERERARARETNALRHAIRDRRIGCAFQPKVDFRAGEIDSLEVLMRWRDEDGAWSPPGNFLDLAHEIGLTAEITDIVFEQTLAALDAVDRAFGSGPRLGFNIAARLACDVSFMRAFLERLASSGHARRFVLEITEEAFLPAARFQERVLPMIREIGAGVSIDDFGSGYSSLATLADVTADEVKIDRSLITDIDTRPRNQSLLRAIESIGEALATEVIVEGVETQAEYDWLCDFTKIRVAQGYFFGRPEMLGDTTSAREFREIASGRNPSRARVEADTS